MSKQTLPKAFKRVSPIVSISTLCLSMLGSKSNRPPLTVTWVSTDRVEFEPEEGEQLRLRYRINAPGLVKVRFLDPSGNVVRAFEEQVEKPGERQIVWDGRDGAGNLVPAEAYVYTISARGKDLDEPSSPVIYDPRDRTGGETVHVERVTWDPESGKLVYAVSQPARVRVILGRISTGWPVGTRVDWEPHRAGRHEKQWDGWDPGRVNEAQDIPELEPVFHAFALPENAVIVKSSQPRTRASSIGATDDPVPYRLPARAAASDAVLHQHSRHPWSRCYDPSVEISFPESQSGNGPVRLGERTPLRLDVASKKPQGRMAPMPKVSVFVFVDTVLVERNLDGYLPYQWVLDPKELGPGEHVITGLLAWPDDHFGVRHVRVLVVEDFATGR